MGFTKLSESIVNELLRRNAAGESLAKLASEFGVTKAAVSYHIRRRTGIAKDGRKLSEAQSPKALDAVADLRTRFGEPTNH